MAARENCVWLRSPISGNHSGIFYIQILLFNLYFHCFAAGVYGAQVSKLARLHSGHIIFPSQSPQKYSPELLVLPHFSQTVFL